ncbi:MAG: GTPase HflX [Clostridiales Family XIII bacterium]|jgi:GTP-binding protein HflX|nr:GTPase HflX [Clostridiales Family XIII bacterium]
MRFTDDNSVIAAAFCRAILVGIEKERDGGARSMDELAALAEAVGAEVAGILPQVRETPDRRTYIGKGKLDELAELCASMEADTVICNDELSGIQLRNLEDRLGLRVIDRTILILDIFAARAGSREGKLQVELAQLRYRLPRLTGFGKALSSQGGGIGTRGPGEKKLETDRRHIQSRMDEIKKELAEAAAHRQVQRARRKKSGLPLVALVGYTNAGKSAVMNHILRATENGDKAVFEKDMLFATLDTYRRRVCMRDNKEFILVDTVGFVSKLPHSLVKAFRATLEEVAEADLLVHVVDASRADCDFQTDVVSEVLAELGASGNDRITAYNKADLIGDPARLLHAPPGVLPVSATRGDNMDKLLAAIESAIFRDLRSVRLLIPYDRGDIVSYLSEKTPVSERAYTEEGTLVATKLREADYRRLEPYALRSGDA